MNKLYVYLFLKKSDIYVLDVCHSLLLQQIHPISEVLIVAKWQSRISGDDNFQCTPLLQTISNIIYCTLSKYIVYQWRSQAGNEVYAKISKGSGGRLQAPIGSRAKPCWGPRGEAPGSSRILANLSFIFFLQIHPCPLGTAKHS